MGHNSENKTLWTTQQTEKDSDVCTKTVLQIQAIYFKANERRKFPRETMNIKRVNVMCVF